MWLPSRHQQVALKLKMILTLRVLLLDQLILSQLQVQRKLLLRQFQLCLHPISLR
jgi:hypothetical protein